MIEVLEVPAEIAEMEADLAALEAGEVEPVIRLSDEDLAEMEAEEIGADTVRPCWW